MFLKSQTVYQIGLGTQPSPDRDVFSQIDEYEEELLIETVTPEARDFTGAGTPKPQSPVLVPQTFRLPQRLIDDLVRAGELQALSWLDREGNIWLPTNQKSTLP
jgi:hypothetical protein